MPSSPPNTTDARPSAPQPIPALPRTPEPAAGSRRSGFRAAGAEGLNESHTALRLWRKAKRLGVWNPDDIDFARDVEDWQRLDEPQRDVLLQLASQFVGGEEAVTLDLLPLLRAVAADGHLEDEMFLTAFLFEEAKHVDFFHRVLTELTGGRRPDGHRYYGDNYRRLFYDELPGTMHRLDTDPSPERQAEASVVYNMIAEGVVAETGYFAFYSVLHRGAILPGTLRGVRLVKQDESRHLRYGVYLLERLIAEHGERVYEAARRKMEALLPIAQGIHREDYVRIAKQHGRRADAISSLRRSGALEFARRQYAKRLARVESARGKRLEEVLYGTPIDEDLLIDPA